MMNCTLFRLEITDREQNNLNGDYLAGYDPAQSDKYLFPFRSKVMSPSSA
jgi:hypothetical protein